MWRDVARCGEVWRGVARCGEVHGCPAHVAGENGILTTAILTTAILTTAILSMAHVVGEDAHDADLFLAVREGGAALDLGELDAELRRSKHASMQVSSSESQVVSSEW